MPQPKPLFAIFEGGGAKGIAHVGAMKAMEACGFSLAGVAGASAGALVAALAAVGYRADDIFQPDSRDSNLLARLDKTTTGLLGQTRWAGFALLGRRRLALCVSALAGVGASAAALWSGASHWGAAAAFLPGALAPAAAFACIFALPAWRRLGWFDTAAIQDLVNEALRAKLAAIYAADDAAGPEFAHARVLFRHLDPAKFPGVVCPLKVIATDIDSEQLVLFSTAETPDVEIAAAVCASIAIPFAFRPVSIVAPKDGIARRLADGGLVSNLPAWAVIYDKLAWERTNPQGGRVPVVAFRLADPKPPRARARPSRGFGYVRSVARSAVFGGQNLLQNFVDDLHIITLKPRLRVFDFDAKLSAYREGFGAGLNDATRGLRRWLDIAPKAICGGLKDLAESAASRINAIRETHGQAPIAPLRCCLLLPVENQSLRVAYAWNMDKDADDHMVLDQRAPGAPQAFRDRCVVGWRSSFAEGGTPQDFLTKYERALLPKTLKSTICIPILPNTDLPGLDVPAARRNAPIGVVSLDSSADLVPYQSDGALMKRLTDQAALIVPAFVQEAVLKGMAHEWF
jgi:NTE family protein